MKYQNNEWKLFQIISKEIQTSASTLTLSKGQFSGINVVNGDVNETVLTMENHIWINNVDK